MVFQWQHHVGRLPCSLEVMKLDIGLSRSLTAGLKESEVFLNTNNILMDHTEVKGRNAVWKYYHGNLTTVFVQNSVHDPASFSIPTNSRLCLLRL